MKVNTVCARGQASIFMVFWPFSPKKIAKLLKKSERWTMIERVVKSKDLRRQPRSGWPFFHKLCEKYYRKSCKYMCNNSKTQKGKKNSTSHYRSEFRAQRYGYKLPKKVGKPWSEKGGAHFIQACVRRINFIPKKDRPVNSRHVNPLETFWIIVDETTYKDKAPKTLDELRQWLRCAWKKVTLDTLWELVHAIPHRLENIRKHTRRYSGF